MDNNKIIKLKEQEAERQENIRRLEKYKRVKLVTKDEVVAKFGGDIVPTRYGFMSTNISEEDYEKVLDIESRIHDFMTFLIALRTSGDLARSVKALYKSGYLEKHQGVSEDVKERGIILRKDLYSEIEMYTYELDILENELIDELIQQLIDKGVYVAKCRTLDICQMTLAQLSIDGYFNHVNVMMFDVDENWETNKFRFVI